MNDLINSPWFRPSRPEPPEPVDIELPLQVRLEHERIMRAVLAAQAEVNRESPGLDGMSWYHAMRERVGEKLESEEPRP